MWVLCRLSWLYKFTVIPKPAWLDGLVIIQLSHQIARLIFNQSDIILALRLEIFLSLSISHNSWYRNWFTEIIIVRTTSNLYYNILPFFNTNCDMLLDILLFIKISLNYSNGNMTHYICSQIIAQSYNTNFMFLLACNFIWNSLKFEFNFYIISSKFELHN